MKQQLFDVKVPRSWVMNANDRDHWGVRARNTAHVRTLGRYAGRSLANVPPEIRVRIDVDVWKDNGARYDPANLYPTAKAIVDGLRDAGVLVEDWHRHVDGPHLHHGGVDKGLGSRHKGGGYIRLVIRLAPLEEVAE